MFSGALARCNPDRLHVVANNTRYIPAAGDVVVGVVTEREGDSYRVALHGSCSGLLPMLAFEGATKRHKPELVAGSAVFCRLTSTSKCLNPELSCTSDGSGPHMDWSTGQCVYGELKGGQIAQVSTDLARRLLIPETPVLAHLALEFPFEVAVGLNGLVWYQSDTNSAMLTLAETLKRANLRDTFIGDDTGTALTAR